MLGPLVVAGLAALANSETVTNYLVGIERDTSATDAREEAAPVNERTGRELAVEALHARP